MVAFQNFIRVSVSFKLIINNNAGISFSLKKLEAVHHRRFIIKNSMIDKIAFNNDPNITELFKNINI
jgi:hypothetical protein